MNLKQLQATDLSSITRRTTKERLNSLGKTKNAGLLSKEKTKSGLMLTFKSIATYGKNKYSIKILKENSGDLKVWCSCDAHQLQGFNYRLTQKGASLYEENRPDKYWSRFHGSAILCKHLWLLFNNQKNLLKRVLNV